MALSQGTSARSLNGWNSGRTSKTVMVLYKPPFVSIRLKLRNYLAPPFFTVIATVGSFKDSPRHLLRWSWPRHRLRPGALRSLEQQIPRSMARSRGTSARGALYSLQHTNNNCYKRCGCSTERAELYSKGSSAPLRLSQRDTHTLLEQSQRCNSLQPLLDRASGLSHLAGRSPPTVYTHTLLKS